MRKHRRRKNPKNMTGEDIAIVAIAIFGIYVVYDLVVKPAQQIECGVGSAASSLTCFLRNPLCPSYY